MKRGVATLRAALGAGLLLAGAAGLLTTSAAHAATTNSIEFNSPKQPDTTIQDTSSPTIAGLVQVQGCLTGLQLAVRSLDANGDATGDPIATTNAPVPDPQSANNDQTTFSWAPTLAANGRYEATATASYDQPFCGAVRQPPYSGATSFKLSVPPAEPTGLKVSSLSSRRSLSVTWAKNSEPDLTQYLVTRSRKDSGGCQPGGDILASTKSTSYTDSTIPADGGVLCYFVQAQRPDADGKALVSPYSAAGESSDIAALPGASSTTSTTDGGGQSAAGGTGAAGAASTDGTATNGRTTAGDPNLSGFAGSLNGTKRGAPKVSQSHGADGGYKPTLPFNQAAVAAADKEDGADDPNGQQAAAPNTAGGDMPMLSIHAGGNTNQVHTLGAFAAGLVATVILGHLMLLRREVNRTPSLEPTPAALAAPTGSSAG